MDQKSFVNIYKNLAQQFEVKCQAFDKERSGCTKRDREQQSELKQLRAEKKRWSKQEEELIHEARREQKSAEQIQRASDRKEDDFKRELRTLKKQLRVERIKTGNFSSVVEEKISEVEIENCYKFADLQLEYVTMKVNYERQINEYKNKAKNEKVELKQDLITNTVSTDQHNALKKEMKERVEALEKENEEQRERSNKVIKQLEIERGKVIALEVQLGQIEEKNKKLANRYKEELNKYRKKLADRDRTRRLSTFETIPKPWIKLEELKSEQTEEKVNEEDSKLEKNEPTRQLLNKRKAVDEAPETQPRKKQRLSPEEKPEKMVIEEPIVKSEEQGTKPEVIESVEKKEKSAAEEKLLSEIENRVSRLSVNGPPSARKNEKQLVDKTGEIGAKSDANNSSEPEKTMIEKGESKMRYSNYSGVSWIKAYNKWKAQRSINGRSCLGGYYDNEEEAARASDDLIRKFGEAGSRARINFPEENKGKKTDDIVPVGNEGKLEEKFSSEKETDAGKESVSEKENNLNSEESEKPANEQEVEPEKTNSDVQTEETKKDEPEPQTKVESGKQTATIKNDESETISSPEEKSELTVGAGNSATPKESEKSEEVVAEDSKQEKEPEAKESPKTDKPADNEKKTESEKEKAEALEKVEKEEEEVEKIKEEVKKNLIEDVQEKKIVEEEVKKNKLEDVQEKKIAEEGEEEKKGNLDPSSASLDTLSITPAGWQVVTENKNESKEIQKEEMEESEEIEKEESEEIEKEESEESEKEESEESENEESEESEEKEIENEPETKVGYLEDVSENEKELFIEALKATKKTVRYQYRDAVAHYNEEVRNQVRNGNEKELHYFQDYVKIPNKTSQKKFRDDWRHLLEEQQRQKNKEVRDRRRLEKNKFTQARERSSRANSYSRRTVKDSGKEEKKSREKEETSEEKAVAQVEPETTCDSATFNRIQIITRSMKKIFMQKESVEKENPKPETSNRRQLRSKVTPQISQFEKPKKENEDMEQDIVNKENSDLKDEDSEKRTSRREKSKSVEREKPQKRKRGRPRKIENVGKKRKATEREAVNRKRKRRDRDSENESKRPNHEKNTANKTNKPKTDVVQSLLNVTRKAQNNLKLNEQNKKDEEPTRTTESPVRLGKFGKGKSSQYIGVSWSPTRCVWIAERKATSNGRPIKPTPKAFKNEEEAARYSDSLVDVIKLQYSQYKGVKNFPPEDQDEQEEQSVESKNLEEAPEEEAPEEEEKVEAQSPKKKENAGVELLAEDPVEDEEKEESTEAKKDEKEVGKRLESSLDALVSAFTGRQETEDTPEENREDVKAAIPSENHERKETTIPKKIPKESEEITSEKPKAVEPLFRISKKPRLSLVNGEPSKVQQVIPGPPNIPRQTMAKEALIVENNKKTLTRPPLDLYKQRESAQKSSNPQRANRKRSLSPESQEPGVQPITADFVQPQKRPRLSTDSTTPAELNVPPLQKFAGQRLPTQNSFPNTSPNRRMNIPLPTGNQNQPSTAQSQFGATRPGSRFRENNQMNLSGSPPTNAYHSYPPQNPNRRNNMNPPGPPPYPQHAQQAQQSLGRTSYSRRSGNRERNSRFRDRIDPPEIRRNTNRSGPHGESRFQNTNQARSFNRGGMGRNRPPNRRFNNETDAHPVHSQTYNSPQSPYTAPSYQPQQNVMQHGFQQHRGRQTSGFQNQSYNQTQRVPYNNKYPQPSLGVTAGSVPESGAERTLAIKYPQSKDKPIQFKLRLVAGKQDLPVDNVQFTKEWAFTKLQTYLERLPQECILLWQVNSKDMEATVASFFKFYTQREVVACHKLQIKGGGHILWAIPISNDSGPLMRVLEEKVGQKLNKTGFIMITRSSSSKPTK